MVFLPSIYSLLSVSKLVFGNIYLYYLLAILVFYYISPAIGRLYFVLTPIVIILYLDMILQKPLPIDMVDCKINPNTLHKKAAETLMVID